MVKEHDIRTGERTGRVSFDPQFGSGGDLVVDGTADGAQVLLEISAEKPYYARWLLGPDVGGREVTRRGVGRDGMQPRGTQPDNGRVGDLRG